MEFPDRVQVKEKTLYLFGTNNNPLGNSKPCYYLPGVAWGGGGGGFNQLPGIISQVR